MGFGDVGDIYLPTERGTGRSRGFAFVRYYDKRDAQDALDELNGRTYDGRELRIKIDEGRPNRGGGDRGGRGGRYDDRDRGGRGGRYDDRDRGERRGRDRSDSRDRDRHRRSESGEGRRERSRSNSRGRGRSGSKDRSKSRSRS